MPRVDALAFDLRLDAGHRSAPSAVNRKADCVLPITNTVPDLQSKWLEILTWIPKGFRSKA